MLSKYSSNVILTKVRAMYGSRLKKEDYDNLMICKSVKQIASYLKNNTSYSSVLASIDDKTVHRGHLEAVIKTKVFYNIEKLLRFELSTGNSFSKYLIARTEIQQIVRSLALLLGGKNEDYAFGMPMYFNKFTKINFSTLASAKNYDDFLSALGKSHYRELLEKYHPKNGNAVDIESIECELYNYLYETLQNGIDGTANKYSKQKLWDIISDYIDYGNFIRIYRSKKMGLQPDESSIVKYGNLKKKYIDNMLAAENAKEVLEIMKTTNLGKRLAKVEYNYIDEVQYRMIYDKCRMNIHMSIDPSIVMLSYIFLMQIELSNIITIIEGVRYGLPKSDIEKLLTLKVRQ